MLSGLYVWSVKRGHGSAVWDNYGHPGKPAVSEAEGDSRGILLYIINIHNLLLIGACGERRRKGVRGRKKVVSAWFLFVPLFKGGCLFKRS